MQPDKWLRALYLSSEKVDLFKMLKGMFALKETVLDMLSILNGKKR